jgi:hypothetical protein
MRPPCAPEGARSEREGAPHDARGRACAAPTPPRPSQVLREQEGVRGYAELQSKHRAAYGDDEEAREAAGRASPTTQKNTHTIVDLIKTRLVNHQVTRGP